MIDPSIPLAFKPPQFNDPLEQQGKILNLLAARQQIQNAPLHTQALQQQIQTGALENEQRQTAIDEEKGFKAALARNASPFELLSTAPKLAGPHLKAIAEQQKMQLDSTKQKTTMLANALGAVKYAAPEMQAQRYGQVRQDAINQGLVKPEDVPEQYDPAFVDQHFRAAIDADKQIDNHAKELDQAQRVIEAAPKTAKEWTDLILKEGSAARSQNELDQTRASLQGLGVPKALLAQTLPAMWSEAAMQQLGDQSMSPEQRRQVGIQKQNADTAAKNAENNVSEYELRLRAAKGDANAQKALKESADEKIRVAQVEAQNKWNLQAGAGMGADGQPSELAKSVGNYEIPLQQALSRVPPAMRETIMKQIKAVNPTFQASNYDVARKTELDATTGNLARTSNSQSTALAHMDVLNTAVDALKNGDIKILNQLGNSLGVQVGKTAKTTFEAIVHKVGPELASAYLAGGGSVGERGATEKDFDPSLSPDQLKSNIAISAKLLSGKIQANQEQYSRGTYGRGKQELIGKEAKAALDRLSGGKASSADTSGGYLRTAVGANGHTIGQKPDGGWYDTATGAKVQ